MFYQENLVIDKKYLNIANACIYNVQKNKHGIISEINISFLVTGAIMQFTAFYDKINDNEHFFINDFIIGKMKFVLFKGDKWESGLYKDVQNKELASIKEAFADDYKDDMIMWIDEKERKIALEEQDHRYQQHIGSELVNLDSFAEEVIYDSYSTLKAFSLYANRIIDEKQMLYAMVNILAAEKRVERDFHLKERNENLAKHISESFDKFKDLKVEDLQ